MNTLQERIQTISPAKSFSGPVVYWMSRDQRIHHNWALIHARHLASRSSLPLRIVFCLAFDYPGAGLRQYHFMLHGLVHCCREAAKLNIPLDVILGNPEDKIPEYLISRNASLLVMDFDPLRTKQHWQQKVLQKVDTGVDLVDAHNIVPCWVASDKQEYAARTIRPKIHRKLDQFLEPFPEIKPIEQSSEKCTLDPDQLLKTLNPDPDAGPADGIVPGSHEAMKILEVFVETGLYNYAEKRNDPNEPALSGLSPYLHFGHICSQTIALKLKQHPSVDHKSAHFFLEELIIRKELSDNFCFYNQNYYSFKGLPDWGKNTLNRHRADKRPMVYSLEELEHAATEDPLWNAAQQEMTILGKMHGYMRMYWAKKILEWSPDPEQAIERAIFLNDKYELDGRDPNGYTGILWSIGGLHDRPWKERPVFGTVRYMSYKGCRRKFDVQAYIRKWNNGGQEK
ncbi:MAG: deoxyribodipyrimidine photo-lyase [Desulfonatronovibrionaceae bacterium]